MGKEKLKEFEYIFDPSSVAVIGASETDDYSRALGDTKMKEKLFLVNPNHEELHGIKCYPSILDIEEKIDYVVIAVPTSEVPKVLEESIKKGVKVAHIFSSGFSETGVEERMRLEEEVKEMADGKVRLIGPNCMGIYCPKSGLTFTHGAPTEGGPVGMVTQSGTFAVRSAREAEARNLRFSKAISYGNAVDLDCPDFLEYLGDDPETEIITLYVEGTEDGRRLKDVLERVARKKPVIALKGGLTEHGSRAASSHTASLAGSPKVWESFFRQVGAVQVKTFDELMDTALAFLHSPIPKGNGISIITPSGGFSVTEADTCVRIGFEVPEFSKETKNELRDLVPVAGTSIRNPLDAWPSFESGTILEAVKVVASDENIHSLILDFHMSVSSYKRRFGDVFDEFFKEFLKRGVDTYRHVQEDIEKPLALSMPVSISWSEEERIYQMKARSTFQDVGVPIYPSIKRAAKAIFNLYRYYKLTRTTRVSS